MTKSKNTLPVSAEIFDGEAKSAALFNAVEWRMHALGAPAHWSREFLTSLSICFNSPHPSFILWGGEQFYFYNDAWRQRSKEDHSNALAKPFLAVWPEAWGQAVIAAVQTVRSSGETLRQVCPFFLPENEDSSEGAYFELSLSPIKDSDNSIAGVYVSVTEVAKQKAGDKSISEESVAEALRESELRYRLVSEAANDFIWDWNLVTDEVIRNEGLRKIFGYTPDQMPSESNWGWEQIHEEDRQRVKGGVEAALEDGSEFWTDDYRYRRADGTYATVVGRAQIVRDAKGKPMRMVSSVRDISDRKAAEEALRESEQRFRMLADTAPAMLWVTDAEGQCTFLSRGWFEFTGQNEKSGLGRGWHEAIHPEDRKEAERIFAEANRERKAFSFDYRLRQADGKYRWALDAGRPRFDAQGEFAGFIGSVIDISERKKAEEARKQIENRFALVEEATGLGVWYCNLPFDKLDWNRRTKGHFWLNDEEVTIETFWNGIHPEDRERTRLAIEWAISSKTVYDIEYRTVSPSGEIKWIRAMGTASYDTEGNPVHFDGFTLDVTPHKLAEEALTRNRAELERLVLERTRQLEESHERLRLSERFASLGTLSAGLGHDMGNLLVPVRVRVEALERAGLSASALEDVQAIKTSAAYLQRLANGLRLLAIDPEKSYTGEATELKSWWEDAVGVLKTVLPRGIKLEQKLPETECWVQLSRTALTQVVFNLVQNAGDAMRRDGNGVITLSGKVAGDKVILSIKDSGPGMSPEVKARCMEPFYTTKARGISTGLGLVLVYGLVREAGGVVDIESNVGQGTNFILTLDAGKRPLHWSNKTGPARSALVQVKDARMRAFVTAELNALSFKIEKEDKAQPHLVVADSEDRINGDAENFIFLGDLTSARPGVLALGRNPKPHALREALQEIARS